MTVDIHPATLKLESVGASEAGVIEVSPEHGATIGRSLRCDHVLDLESVSRKHFSVTPRGGRWLLTDLGSRHGTALNGHTISPGLPAVLSPNDLIAAGACAFRVKLGEDTAPRATTIASEAAPGSKIEEVAAGELGRLARHRLDLLLDCATMIHGATDEGSLADAALKAALAGTGFDHAAMLRPHDTAMLEVEVIGHRDRESATAPAGGFSRSLLRHAASGQTARLLESSQLPTSVSIVSMGITAAVCTPIMLGSGVAAFLYLDARGHDTSVAPDATAFCQVIARMAGLALANLKRMDLELRQTALDAELDAAREAQLLIVPDDRGEAGPLRYAMEMRPGKYVAGDLFEVIRLDRDRAAVCIGDVTGEGIGAAVIMAAAQSHLHGALRRGGDPAAAVNEVNGYLAGCSAHGRFVSMWVGVLDRASGVMEFVDAGHGHWLFKPAGEGPRAVDAVGGIPAGIDGDFVYRSERIDMRPGDRIILYSDGLVEQESSAGEAFGNARVTEAVAAAGSAAEDVDCLMAAFDEFTGSAPLKDDTTVASVESLES